MSVETKSKKGFANKCGGVPFYPKKHSFFTKRLVGLSDEYIKEHEKDAVKFLNKHGFDLSIEDD